ncbi:hypothetical protein Sps_03501 [Shewanella psychrophila]|uniref:Uncharacterized protein n=1 Tax=Shewanella psychrophila TaxID=225848 RepID=A0A1S6HT36_9GAMM|nr:hypothetical protein [Shewanella psychrophila]AQS38628.1 hypothetical protein Sps_03501 [Shewanella psychrophila]
MGILGGNEEIRTAGTGSIYNEPALKEEVIKALSQLENTGSLEKSALVIYPIFTVARQFL